MYAPHPAVEFRRASYRTPQGRTILDALDLAVVPGETLVVLGRSGSGKTTALRLVNRLLEPSEGEVRVEGRSTLAWDPIRLRRRTGYVIQDVGLLPHYTVEDNVALVPRLEGWAEARVRARVRDLLLLVGLDPERFARRYPHELSGGQRQRVAVARALAASPALLLFDEPFGALDPLTRHEMQQQFLALRQRYQIASIFVTHDVLEALSLATRIALLEQGRLELVATPRELLQSTAPVARLFLNTLPPQFLAHLAS